MQLDSIHRRYRNIMLILNKGSRRYKAILWQSYYRTPNLFLSKTWYSSQVCSSMLPEIEIWVSHQGHGTGCRRTKKAQVWLFSGPAYLFPSWAEGSRGGKGERGGDILYLPQSEHVAHCVEIIHLEYPIRLYYPRGHKWFLWKSLLNWTKS